MSKEKFFARVFSLAFLLLVSACITEPTAMPTSSPTPSPMAKAIARAASPIPASGFVEATPSAPLNVRGTFVYAAGDGSLWLQAAVNGDAAPLVARSTESIAQMPAYSPDGTQIAYAALLFLADGNVRGDIRTANADGKNIQTVVRAEANDVVYMYPRYAPDGRLLVTRAENLQTTNERARLEWANEGGVIEDARDADVSRDGSHIAFVRYDLQNATMALWLANADGTNQKELVAAETFAAILNPRFSRDGRWIAFGVHGEPRKTLPLAARPRQPASNDDSCFLVFLSTCLVQTAHAHAAPGALWRVNVANGKFQQLTDIYDDSPVPAWSRDGTQIAIHDYTGIRLIDLVRKEIYPLFLEDGGSDLTPNPSPTKRGEHLTPNPSPTKRGEHLTPNPSPTKRGEHLTPNPSPT
ncbi:MAG: PD40 domain-containing protein, partial [Chloroflexi bacterium]|nr:PD40 domain-containing protein [Chloroflexota bacterium]